MMDPEKIILREASFGDIDSLALVGSSTFLETFAGILDGSAIVAHCRKEHSPEAYRALLETGAAAWLAEMNPGGAPVGFAIMGPTDLPGRSSDGSDIELKRIYVLSRLIGHGLGRNLMLQAITAATNLGAGRLLLGVYAHNARAIAFYRKAGFVPIAGRQFQVGDKAYDDLVLARPLA